MDLKLLLHLLLLLLLLLLLPLPRLLLLLLQLQEGGPGKTPLFTAPRQLRVLNGLVSTCAYY